MNEVVNSIVTRGSMMKRVIGCLLLLVMAGLSEARPVVMLTGYWAPTSEMIYRFSNDPILNPDGWIGENWEGRGYDVYAFFPAFDVTTREFEVDYQDTWNDFWARTEEFHPEIIISFGAGDGPWEIEYRAINRSNWDPDDFEPYYPTPNPPDSTIAPNASRFSTLPTHNIRNAVNEQTEVYAWIDTYGDPGNFLCNYIAYLGMWYQSIHSSEDDEYYCKAAGFIHVDGDFPVPEVTLAAEVTLRATLEYYENIADLAGNVSADSPLENCTITLRDYNDQIYETGADQNGDFLFEDIQFGEYAVTALSGRYGFYQGEFVFDSADDFLAIEIGEYSPLEPVTYCQGADQLASLDTDSFVLTASYFPPQLFESYLNCHLNSILFTAPENSSECSSALFLYQGNPLEGSFSLLEGINLPDFQQGELVEAPLSEMYFLTEDIIQHGLTIAFGINNPNDYIGYTDNSVANPNGNLIRTGPVWHHADEEHDIQGNWDLRLGLFGNPESVNGELVAVVTDYQLSNYPNPFNPSTTISFSVANTMASEIIIYNIRGRKVRTIPINSRHGSVEQTVVWNGADDRNQPVASGVYVYRLNTPDSPVRKMVLVR
jgi:pyrrolidone-carboxylate peptidase